MCWLLCVSLLSSFMRCSRCDVVCVNRDVAAFDCHSSIADSLNYGFVGGCGSLLGQCDLVAAECG